METFVVRVWVPAELDEEVAERVLHGVVEHIGGISQPFADGAGLLAFLREATTSRRVGRERRVPGRVPPTKEENP